MFPDRVLTGDKIEDVTAAEGETAQASGQSNTNNDDLQGQEIRDNGQQSIDRQTQSQTSRDPDVDDSGGWFAVEKLLSTKIMNNKRYYEVKWKNGDPPTFEKESDISDVLKREFHRTRTLAGRLRKNIRNRFRDYVYN
jgi:hypothetical protein